MPRLRLLVLDMPASIELMPDASFRQGFWHEPKSVADASLASLLTGGVPPISHGVIDEWELRPDGQALRRAPRHRLMQPPLWESIPRSVAVGLPWSRGSHAAGCVVSPDYIWSELSDNSAALPDRIWPETLVQRISDARLQPHELDNATISQLGFSSASSHIARELSAWLSLHMIGTLLLEQEQPDFFALRLRFESLPINPAATARFIQSAISRYQSISGTSEIKILIRRHNKNQVECILLGTQPATPMNSSQALGKSISAHFALENTEQSKLTADYWKALRARCQPPQNTLPGMKTAITELTTRIDEAMTTLFPADQL